MLNIAFGLHNKNDYFIHTLTCIYSIIANTQRQLCFHILHDATVTAAHKELFVRLCEGGDAQVRFVDVQAYVARFAPYMEKDFSVATFFRILLPVLFSDTDILYMDSDVCCTLDISLLEEAAAHPVALVSVVHDEAIIMPRFSAYVSALGLDGSRYFNCGIMYLYCARICQTYPHFAEDVLQILATRPFNFPDQDAINIFFSAQTGTVHYMDSRFNYCMSVKQRHMRNPQYLSHHVLHYGYHKPWLEAFAAGLVYWKYREAMFARIGGAAAE